MRQGAWRKQARKPCKYSRRQTVDVTLAGGVSSIKSFSQGEIHASETPHRKVHTNRRKLKG